MQPDFIFTSESVTEGHPDKLCDQISDALLGSFLRQDLTSHLIAECAISTGILFISVKYRSGATVNVVDTARDVIRRVGYAGNGFDAESCTIMTSFLPQDREDPKPDETRLQDGELELVLAREQATMFGFACNHTPELMPLPISVAHALARRLAEERRSGKLDFLGPDGKTQVAIEFRDRQPHRVHGVSVMASQRDRRSPSASDLRDAVIEQVIRPVLAEQRVTTDARTRLAVNPDAGTFLGGPAQHAGLTGRKTAVDTYGEWARHSGAALSGKDPSRIDRSGAYAARYAAKNVVAAGLAEQCEVQLSYSVGEASPVSIQVETYGTARIEESEIARRLHRVFDFRVAAVVRDLRLREIGAGVDGIYAKLAVYGQVGRSDLTLPWESLDKVDALR